MAKYKALKFKDLLNVIEIYDDETGDTLLLGGVAEKKYSEILEHVRLTNLSGELTLKIKFTPPDGVGRIVIAADVIKKLKKVKNEIVCEQNDDGKVFLDNPNQQVLDGVLKEGVE